MPLFVTAKICNNKSLYLSALACQAVVWELGPATEIVHKPYSERDHNLLGQASTSKGQCTQAQAGFANTQKS
jgi:hypothetical protein